MGGIDDTGMRLFETDPTGIFFEYKATSIGEGETVADEILHKEYKDSMLIKDGLKLAVKALIKAIEDVEAKRLDCAYIDAKTKNFVRISQKEIDEVVSSVKKGK